MRFIWNFFFFGILFYLIWMFFPDAFMTLVSWANNVVAFLKDLILDLWDKIHPYVTSKPSEPPPQEAPKAFILFPMLLQIWFNKA